MLSKPSWRVSQMPKRDPPCARSADIFWSGMVTPGDVSNIVFDCSSKYSSRKTEMCLNSGYWILVTICIVMRIYAYWAGVRANQMLGGVRALSPSNYFWPDDDMKYISTFNTLGNADVVLVGGTCASLSEMVSHLGAHGVRSPNRFAITAQVYFDFLSTKYSYGTNGSESEMEASRYLIS
jgi:hypothetical protein